MKTPSDSLHQLITSLTPQEKKYFRQFASRHVSEKKPVYLRLFDAIESQPVFDEKEIKKQFKKEKFIEQLFVTKNYLYEMILQSLGAFHKDHTLVSELMNMLQHIDILFDKGLYDQAEKLTLKAEKAAKASENFILLLEIINRKLKIVHSSFHKLSENELHALYDEKQLILNNLNNLHSFEWLNTLLLSKVNQKGWFTRSEEEIKRDYLPIIEHELFKDEQSANSLSAKILFYSTLSSSYYIMGEREKSYRNSLTLVKLFEKHPEIILNNTSEYVQSISRLVFTLVAMGKFEEGLDYIGKAKQLKFNSAMLNAKIISSIYLNEVIIYNIIGGLEKGITMIQSLEEKFEQLNRFLIKTDICYFYYNFACLYFKNRDFDSASKYLFKLINDPDIQYLPHIQGNVRIMNLMVQFELNNFDVLPYLIRSTYRYLLKQRRMFRFETVFLKFIKKLPNIATGELRNEFKKLRENIKELEEDPYERNALHFFAVPKWLENRMKREVNS